MGTLAAGAMALALALAACGDDDDDGAASSDTTAADNGDTGTDGGDDTGLRERYVDAIAATAGSDDDEFTPDDDRCIAEAAVDAIGVEKIQAAVTPEEIEASGDFDPLEAGIDVTEEEGSAFYDGVTECVDIRQTFLDSFAEGQSLPQEAIDCIDQAIDDQLLKDIMVTVLIEGEEGLSRDPELGAELERAVTPCATASAGG